MPRSRPSLRVETLEDRLTPAVTAAQSGGVLTVALSGATDAATIGGQQSIGNFVTVAGTGFAGASFSNVTSIVVNNTSGVAGTQGVRFQDVNNGIGRIDLTGSLTVTNVHTVDFNNPTFPLAATSITITGGKFITSSNNLRNLASGGTIVLSASGVGPNGTSIDVIGTATNPIRIVPSAAPSLAADTFAGAGNQYYDFGGSFENVNGGTTGIMRAGTGTITFTNGQLFGQGADDFGNNTTLNVGGGGVLSVFNTEVIAGLTGTGTVRTSGAGTHTLAVGNNGASSTFAGTLQNGPGTLALRKQGSGDFTLAGANTYTGPTNVVGGRLLVTGSLAAGSAVTVSGTDPNDSTFLGGSGVIGGPVQVRAGGVIGPGFAPVPGNVGTATLGTGSLSFQPGGAFGVKVVSGAAGFFDALNVTGSVNLTDGAIFVVPIASIPAVGTVLTVIANDGSDPVVGTFAGLPEGGRFQDAAGTFYRINYAGGDGNDVTLTALGSSLLPSVLLATGPGTGTGTVFTPTGGQYQAGEQATLVPGFGGELHVAVGDVTGDRVPDFVVGTGPGGSRVRVLDGATGAPLADFVAFPGYTGGVFVAVGDLTGDGFGDVVVTPDAADAFSGPVPNQLPVRVYSGASLRNGTGSPTVVAAFDGLASLSGAGGQGNPDVKLGGRPAVADVNGDGLPDLLIAAGNGGGPRVTVWNGTGFPAATGGAPTTTPLANLFVFESTQRGGAFVAAGDITGDRLAEIVVGGGPGGGPRLRVINPAVLLGLANLEGVDLDDPTNLSNGLVLNNFFAGDGGNRGGVRVAVRDADGDQLGDVVTGSGTGERSAVRVYRSPALAAVAGTSGEPANPQAIDPFGVAIPGGVWVG